MNLPTSMVLYFLLFATIIFYILLRMFESKKSKAECKNMIFHRLNLSDAEIAMLHEFLDEESGKKDANAKYDDEDKKGS